MSSSKDSSTPPRGDFHILEPVNFENLSKLTPVMKLRWALIRPAEASAKAPE
jgi:hypothetical protein